MLAQFHRQYYEPEPGRAPDDSLSTSLTGLHRESDNGRLRHRWVGGLQQVELVQTGRPSMPEMDANQRRHLGDTAMAMGRLKEFYIRGERYEEGAEGETRCNSHQNLYENIIRTIAAGYLCARKRISSFQKRTLYVHVSYHHALPPSHAFDSKCRHVL